MSDRAEGEMTEHQKAKHAFAMHQDNLFWSRVQLFAIVQGATLAGMYAMREDPTMVWGLTLIGMILTALVLLTMLRDDRLGSKAFEESGVPKTHTGSRRWFKGRYFAWMAFGLLLFADALLLWHVVYGRPPQPIGPKPIPVVIQNPPQPPGPVAP